MTIRYIVGDATNPLNDSALKFIIHVTNNKQRWGNGFVVALSRKWKDPEIQYRSQKQELGDIQTVKVDTGLYVVNMCAQDGFASVERPVALDYEALDKCLNRVVKLAYYGNGSIHAPRFGSGLAGGDWNKISNMLAIKTCYIDIPVTIYDLK